MQHAVENGLDSHMTNGATVEDEFFEQISEPASDVLSIRRMSTVQDIPPIIHMEDFTPEERLRFEEVLERVAAVDEAERIRQEELKNEMDSLAVTTEDQDNEKACHCCGQPFQFFFNPKKQCGQCSLLVCEKCLNVFRKGVTQICRLCYVEDIHEGQSGKWFMITLQKTGRNANFGCDILRASLHRQKDKEAREIETAIAACSSALSDVSSVIESVTKSSLKSIGKVATAKTKFKLRRKAKKDLMNASSDVSLAMSEVESASRDVERAEAAADAYSSIASDMSSQVSLRSAHKKFKLGKETKKKLMNVSSDVSLAMDSVHSASASAKEHGSAISAEVSENIEGQREVSCPKISPEGPLTLLQLATSHQAISEIGVSLTDAHEERGVDILEGEASELSASVDRETANAIPTITVARDSDEDRWEDHPYSQKENDIFPNADDNEQLPVGLRTPNSAVSHESLTSIYSVNSDSYKLAVDVTGEVQLALEFNFKRNIFFVKIKQCRNIAAIHSKSHKSDPYVKTYLLPDKTKESKRKTAYRKATLNPVFDEQVKYVIPKSELDTRILSVSVWHHVTLGHNIFLGEAHIPLEENDFDDATAKWYPLHEKRDIAIPMPLMMYKGDLVFAVKFVPPEVGGTEALGEVQVWVKQARNLIAAAANGYSDAFCKAYLLPDRSPIGKKKTRVIRRNLNPAWNTVLRFSNVSEDSLSDRSLELTVWDYGRFRPNEFLGGLRLNLGLGVNGGKHVRWMDACGHEVTMWQAMMAKPQSWIEGTLMLRPNMD